MKDDQFLTPPDHVHFHAKRLFGDMGNIMDGAIAYLEPNGGGPTTMHTHAHDHLFIVTEGEAKIQYGEDTVIVPKNSSFLVKGKVPHAVWNHCDSVTVMVGISLKAEETSAS